MAKATKATVIDDGPNYPAEIGALRARIAELQSELDMLWRAVGKPTMKRQAELQRQSVPVHIPGSGLRQLRRP